MMRIKNEFILRPEDFEDYSYGTESTGYIYVSAICKPEAYKHYCTGKPQGLQFEVCFDPETGNIDYTNFMFLDTDGQVIQENGIDTEQDELADFLSYDKNIAKIATAIIA